VDFFTTVPYAFALYRSRLPIVSRRGPLRAAVVEEVKDMPDWASALGWLFAILSLSGSLYALAAAVNMHRLVKRPSLPRGQESALTLLKPLHGLEPLLLENLSSFCVQDYSGPVQIVLGVMDPHDASLSTVAHLRAAYPGLEIVLVVNDSLHGTNPKVSNLLNMLPSASHEILILSDSDIAVPKTYLREVTPALSEPGIGAVTCLYSGKAGGGFWSQLAAMGVSYHFLPNAVTGTAMKLASPCVGATIALRRTVLDEIGGFLGLKDLLADDYEIGRRARDRGYRVTVVPPLVVHVSDETSAADLFAHELRWARTIRMLDVWGHAGSVLTHPFALALLSLPFLAGAFPWLVIAASLAARGVLKIAVDRAAAYRTGPIWLLPPRDLLSFAIFLCSLTGRAVRWRDVSLRADRTGTLSQS
jgi:ceramide glucosyltransferase